MPIWPAPFTILENQIKKEVKLLHSTDSFKKPPFPVFTVNALSVRPERNGGLRIIIDLSRPAGTSVNDYIDNDDFPLTYCATDDAVRI